MEHKVLGMERRKMFDGNKRHLANGRQRQRQRQEKEAKVQSKGQKGELKRRGEKRERKWKKNEWF